MAEWKYLWLAKGPESWERWSTRKKILNTAHFCSWEGSTFGYLADKANGGELWDIRSRVMIASQDNIGALRRASDLGVNVEILEDPGDWQEIIEKLKKHDVDNVFLNGYTPLYPQEAISYILEQKRGISLNQHPSILRDNHIDFWGKAMRGNRPTAARVIQLISDRIEGDDVFTESSVHYVENGLDTWGVVWIKKLDFQDALQWFRQAASEMLSWIMDQRELSERQALWIRSFSQDIQWRLLQLEYENTESIMKQIGNRQPLNIVPEYYQPILQEWDIDRLQKIKRATVKLFPDW